jgi:hypothetical protein
MKATCPKCGSDQLAATKKGFSGGKALAGAVLTGGVGLLAGTIGSNKIKCTCLACGHTFPAGQGKVVYEPGEEPVTPAVDLASQERRRRVNRITLTVFAVLLVLVILVAVMVS